MGWLIIYIIMNRYVVIQTNKKEIIITIIQKKKLSEVYFHCNDSNIMIGDIYLGLIKNTDDSIKASFINIGSVKDAFLHYYDLGLQLKCLLSFLYIKNFNYLSQIYNHLEELSTTENWYLNKILQSNTKILVQITKESISNKGPKLTTEICLAGRFLILIPYIEKIYLSQRIIDFKKRKQLFFF
jgi:ribonuclease G